MGDVDSGGGGAGGPLGIYDYEALRAAVLADSPADLGAMVLTWLRMEGVLQNIGSDLSPIINAIGDAVSTQHIGPALIDRLVGLAARVHNLTVDLHSNASAVNQADLALRAAQKEFVRLDGDGTRKWVDLRTGKDQRAAEAGRIAYALNDAYGDAITMLVVPSEKDREAPPDGAGEGASPGPVATPRIAPPGARPSGRSLGRGRPTDGLAPVPGSRSPGGPPGRLPPTGPGVGVLAPGPGTPGGSGSPSGSGSGAPGRRVQVPGARGGGPIGGSRIPVVRGGSLGAPGGGGALPGSAPGTGSHEGPGTPSRPGAVPPGGPGNGVPPGGVPGRGGTDGRRGRRLSWYERIEDEFVDKRAANPPGGVIGAARDTPGAADPGPAVIGTQKQQPSAEPRHEAWELSDATVASPQGFPDKLENGSFAQRDGTRIQVRRRSGA